MVGAFRWSPTPISLARHKLQVGATSHMRLRAHDHLHFKHSHWWKKAEPVQVRLSRRLRDQHSMCMQDGCKFYMYHYVASHGSSCFAVTSIVFPKPPLGGRPNTKPGDHGTPSAHARRFISTYHAWEPAWIEIHWSSIWSWSHITSHYTWGPVTTLHEFGGGLETTAFAHFLLSSHNIYHSHG